MRMLTLPQIRYTECRHISVQFEDTAGYNKIADIGFSDWYYMYVIALYSIGI